MARAATLAVGTPSGATPSRWLPRPEIDGYEMVCWMRYLLCARAVSSRSALCYMTLGLSNKSFGVCRAVDGYTGAI